MRSKLASGNPMPPDVTSTEAVRDTISGESEGSCSDASSPSPQTLQHHGHHHHSHHNPIHGSHDSAHDYDSTRLHFGSFYLRMGAVGKLLVKCYPTCPAIKFNYAKVYWKK